MHVTCARSENSSTHQQHSQLNAYILIVWPWISGSFAVSLLPDVLALCDNNYVEVLGRVTFATPDGKPRMSIPVQPPELSAISWDCLG
jgi:hypothetical protein